MSMNPCGRRMRREAGILLGDGNRRTVMTLSGILILFICSLAFVMSEVQSFVSTAVRTIPADVWTVAFWIIAVCLSVFFVIPILISYQTMGVKIVRQADLSLSDLFSPFFDARTYRMFLLLSVGVVWRLALVVLSASIGIGLVLSFLSDRIFRVLLTSAIVLFAGMIGILIWAGRFSQLYFVFGLGYSVKEAETITHRYYAKNLSVGLRFFFCDVLPQLVLGFFTVGIWWVADVMERMPVMYYLFCQKIYPEGSGENDQSISEVTI